MKFKATASENDNAIIQDIYKLLNIKAGDSITWELKDNVVQLKKMEISTPSYTLTKNKVDPELRNTVKAEEKDEMISTEEVKTKLQKLRSS